MALVGRTSPPLLVDRAAQDTAALTDSTITGTPEATEHQAPLEKVTQAATASHRPHTSAPEVEVEAAAALVPMDRTPPELLTIEAATAAQAAQASLVVTLDQASPTEAEAAAALITASHSTAQEDPAAQAAAVAVDNPTPHRRPITGQPTPEAAAEADAPRQAMEALES